MNSPRAALFLSLSIPVCVRNIFSPFARVNMRKIMDKTPLDFPMLTQNLCLNSIRREFWYIPNGIGNRIVKMFVQFVREYCE